MLLERVARMFWRVCDGHTRPAGAVLEVIRLDRSSWRISDSSIDEHDPRRLIGYVERVAANRYEVLWLTDPVAWAYVASFDDALAAMADRNNFLGTIEPQRDPSIDAPTALLFHRINRRRNSPNASTNTVHSPADTSPAANSQLNGV